MKKNNTAKWILGTAAVAAVAAFTVGVIHELKNIKKLTTDADSAENPEATDAPEETAAPEEAPAEETAENADQN